MGDDFTVPEVDKQAAAEILTNLGRLMSAFHEDDVALQNAVSALTGQERAPPALRDLQHIDLITQTHADLAKLMPVLARCVRGTPMPYSELRRALTLRSLQDLLIGQGSNHERPDAGELSLF